MLTAYKPREGIVTGEQLDWWMDRNNTAEIRWWLDLVFGTLPPENRRGVTDHLHAGLLADLQTRVSAAMTEQIKRAKGGE
jgi:hypothetical protein